eukprot:g6358.t1
MIWAAKVLRLELTVVFLFGVTVFVAWSCIFAIRVLKLASEEDYGTLRGRLWNYASLLRRFAWAFSSTCLTGILWQGREPSEDESGTETRRHASSATRLSDDMGEEDREIFKATVEDLAGRGLTLRSLTGFWGDLLDLEIMPHFDPRLSSTNDVVRQAIIPMSRQGSGGKALACLWEDQPLFPTTMVTHNWSNVFGHLVAAVLADALGKDTYAGVAAQLTSKKGLEQLKLHLDAEGKLDSTCWICAFSVNQHASICGGFGPEPDRVREPERWKCWDRSRRDSVTDRAFLVCSCQVPKAFDQSDASCEINKFDDMMHFLQQQDIGFGQLVVVDEHFGVLHRAWCIAEIVEGNTIAGEDGNFRMRATVYSQNSVFLNYDSLAVLDVRECCATLEKDREFILSKIEGQEAEFNMKLQNFIFGSKGLFRTWVDSRERGRRVAFIWRKAAALASENLHPSCAERVVEFFLFRPPIWSPKIQAGVDWFYFELLPGIEKEERALSFSELQSSAQWAAELLAALPGGEDASAPNPLALPENGKAWSAVMLAKAHLQMREYSRAAAVLLPEGVRMRSSCAIFFRSYALYMAGEKRKEEEIAEVPDPVEKGQVKNPELIPGKFRLPSRSAGQGQLVFRRCLSGKNSTSLRSCSPSSVGSWKDLEEELAMLYQHEKLDGLGLYLYGITLKGLERKEEARRILLESVSAFPCNWSAWLDPWTASTACSAPRSTRPEDIISISSDLNDVDECRKDLNLPNHWMSQFFEAAFELELQRNESAKNLYLQLRATFPDSSYLTSQLATCFYNMRHFDASQAAFEEMRKRDPYRLTSLDTYSNILFVKERSAALSHLARHVVKIDKYTPEACSIIGNYYSLKGEHEKAVIYFQRALSLNRHFTPAWILMGHEFMEMKNTPAAIDAYRTAVTLNQRDYRAWYGLGQTYELLSLHYYALFYYRRAMMLRPDDARMWCAMAQCYDLMGRKVEALRCYEKAHRCGDRERMALPRLARLHRDLGQRRQAAAYYTQMLEQNGLGDVGAGPLQPVGLSTEDLGQCRKALGSTAEGSYVSPLDSEITFPFNQLASANIEADEDGWTEDIRNFQKAVTAMSRSDEVPKVASATLAAALSASAIRHNQEMVQIPAGRFHMGDRKERVHFPQDGEGPVRPVRGWADSRARNRRASIDAFRPRGFRRRGNWKFWDFVVETQYVTDAERLGDSFVAEVYLSDAVSATILKKVDAVPWWLPVPNASWRTPEGVDSGLDEASGSRFGDRWPRGRSLVSRCHLGGRRCVGFLRCERRSPIR